MFILSLRIGFYYICFNMKRLIICVFLIIQLGYTKKSDSIASNNINTFQEGEWFQLRLHYGPFNASYATLSLKEIQLKESLYFTQRFW